MEFNRNTLALTIRVIEVVLLIALLAANTVGVALLALTGTASLNNDEIAVTSVTLYIVNGVALLWVVLRVGIFFGNRMRGSS